MDLFATGLIMRIQPHNPKVARAILSHNHQNLLSILFERLFERDLASRRKNGARGSDRGIDGGDAFKLGSALLPGVQRSGKTFESL